MKNKVMDGVDHPIPSGWVYPFGMYTAENLLPLVAIRHSGVSGRNQKPTI
jgi:hypothetical protein